MLAAFITAYFLNLVAAAPAIFECEFEYTIRKDASHLLVFALITAILINEFTRCAIMARFFSCETNGRVYFRLKRIIDRGFAGIWNLLDQKFIFT